jgi:antitoxin (DNA-binding transcriptional repressor) of toxin-antitoxin stability system
MVKAKSHFSALLAEVEAVAETTITRHGKTVAQLIPDHPRIAADAFRDLWSDEDIDLQAPQDTPPKNVASIDD